MPSIYRYPCRPKCTQKMYCTFAPHMSIRTYRNTYMTTYIPLRPGSEPCKDNAQSHHYMRPRLLVLGGKPREPGMSLPALLDRTLLTSGQGQGDTLIHTPSDIPHSAQERIATSNLLQGLLMGSGLKAKLITQGTRL